MHKVKYKPKTIKHQTGATYKLYKTFSDTLVFELESGQIEFSKLILIIMLDNQLSSCAFKPLKADWQKAIMTHKGMVIESPDKDHVCYAIEPNKNNNKWDKFKELFKV